VNDAFIAKYDVTQTGASSLLYSIVLDKPSVSLWLWPGLAYFRKSTAWAGVDRVDSSHALAEAVRRHLHDPQYQADWHGRREAFVREEFLFDGSDLLPGTLGQNFGTLLQNIIKTPNNMDQLLNQNQSEAEQAGFGA
jgi:hypothetical protein